MIIGILSDTHGAAATASAAVELLKSRGAQHLIHCGDVGSDAVLDALAGENAAFVFGNVDYDRDDLARYARIVGVKCLGTFGDIELAGKRLAVTHGDDGRLVKRILDAQQHDYLFVGHTHVKADRRVGKTRVINPGALYRAAAKTVALVDLASDQIEWLIVRSG